MAVHFLRRHAKPQADRALVQLAELAKSALATQSLDSLLGIEGTAARIYFQHLAPLFDRSGSLGAFAFAERSRRPPRDRTNTLLSFLYSMVTKDALIAAFTAGLDPYIGVYHQPRFGRPALALDLAEEFRPLICDSTALMMINNREIAPDHFIERAGAVSLTKAGRRKVIAAYERRMSSKLKHPVFGYSATYRRTLEVQARLLAAVLVGECSEYRPLTTR